MNDPPELVLTQTVVSSLVVKLRGVQGREAVTDPDSGSNPVDDGMIDALQTSPGDLSRQELRQQIADLSLLEQVQLVALLWIGRGDFEPQEWTDAMAQAEAQRVTPTATYILGQPLAADFIAEGWDKFDRLIN